MKKWIISSLSTLLLATSSLMTISVEAAQALRFGAMPATDSVPVLWAVEKGYFEEAGLTVEIVPFTNALNRITAMQTGNIDADVEGLNEFLNLVQQDAEFGKIITTTNDNFQLVAAKDYQKEDDKEIVVGSLLNSVIHYLTLTYFESHSGGFREEYIPEIPVRIQMLQQKQIDMAILPEPIASTAAMQGLTKERLKFDENPNAIIFKQSYLKDNEAAVEAFLKGYNRAIDDLQDVENIEAAKKLLVSKFELPEALLEYIDFPEFEASALPTEAYIQHLQDWLAKEFDQTFDRLYKDVVYEH
ncbi:ABC transporter substrate-binding protein [Aerococcaceae bacterium zg-B36]|uniref:ABC transporter substrate-binding protein n=1 Tax=Aerococcaceae bacterium zg-252 TaxID=2796928 RepID=UPI001BD8B7D3|nr:ABC transporter substrate-binding protein [Aerococcaceae bacterium zg-B36]